MAQASPGSGSPTVSCCLSQPRDLQRRPEPPLPQGRCLAAPQGSREQLLSEAPRTKHCARQASGLLALFYSFLSSPVERFH